MNSELEFLPGQLVQFLDKTSIGIIVGKYEDPRLSDLGVVYLIMRIDLSGAMSCFLSQKPNVHCEHVNEH